MIDYFVSLYDSVDVRLDVVEADSPMTAAQKVGEARDDPQGTLYEVYPRDFSEPAKAILLGEVVRSLD